MDLDAFRWLLTEPGEALLEAAEKAWHEAEGDPVRAAAAVRRREDDPDRAAAALTQARLRDRARAKLGPDARRWWLTSDGLEQATGPAVAEHRAGRLATHVRALDPPGGVVDLGCGIGGDLVALARAGLRVTGVDLDPLRVQVARANLAAHGLAGEVRVGDAATTPLGHHAAAFADPTRRSARGREMDAAGWTPPWPFVTGLLDGSRVPAAVVKAAPGLPHAMVPDGAEAEWVSTGGAVKETALWSATLATARRRATLLSPSGAAPTMTEADDPYDGAPRPVRPTGRYLHEPDGAVVRAGLVTAVAAVVDGGLLDEHIAWVTSDTAQRTPFARSYEVLEELPYREKALRAALRARGIGRLAIKKRGVDVLPERLRQRLALRGDAEGTLVLTRIAGAGAALLVRPLVD